MVAVRLLYGNQEILLFDEINCPPKISSYINVHLTSKVYTTFAAIPKEIFQEGIPHFRNIVVTNFLSF